MAFGQGVTTWAAPTDTLMLTLLFALFALSACAPAVTGDAVTGKILYDDNCATCHAAGGTGGAGPNILGSSTSR